MKKTLLAILSLTASHFVSAQITIDQSDAPKIGQTYYSNSIDPTTFPKPSEGINQTWDYTTSQTIASKDTVSIISPSQAGRTNDFPNSTVVMRFFQDKSTPFRYVDEFFISNAQAFISEGVYFSTNTGTKPDVDFNPNRKIFPFPLYYGSGITYNEYAYVDTEYDNTTNIKATQEVTGWGKLKLPIGTFDAILVKTTEFESYTFSDNTTAKDTVVRYDFLGKGNLLLGTYSPGQKSNNNLKRFEYYTGGINVSTGINDGFIAAGLLKLSYSEAEKSIIITQPDQSAILVLSDINGNVVATENITETHTELPVSALHEGFYIYSLNTSGNKSIRGKVLIK